MVKLANLMSFIALLLLFYSIFSKDKKKMLNIQSLNLLFNSLGNLFIKSYSGVTVNLLSILRNTFSVRNKGNKFINIIILIAMIILGLIFNSKGLIGLIPIIAVSLYTIIVFKTDRTQILRGALIMNSVFWFIYDVVLKLYVAAVSDSLIIIVSIIGIITNKKDSK